MTPAAPMGELADTWRAQGRENLWGRVRGRRPARRGPARRPRHDLHGLPGPAEDDPEPLQERGGDGRMLPSAALRHGPEHLAGVRRVVAEWMEEREYASVRQLCGSA